MNEIIFVTAFKDIKRGEWNNNFIRSKYIYIDYFYNLAYNINYKLAVYVEEETYKIITQKNFFNNNIVFINLNTVNTFLNKHFIMENQVIHSDIYQSKVPPSRRGLPEHTFAEYNLITHSKVNFMKDCKDCFPNYKYYAWIDFGTLNKNVAFIPNNLDLSSLKEKIYCHAYLPLPEKRLDEVQMLSCNDVYILGSGYIAHHNLVDKFESLWEEKIIEWQTKYISDDDQSLVLQLCYDHPDIIEPIQHKAWFQFYPYFFKDKNCGISHAYEPFVNTELCKIMEKNKSNKGHSEFLRRWHHNYTSFYYHNLSSIRNENLRVFELGLGKNNTKMLSNYGGIDVDEVVGGSLHGWSEFLINSKIYGADCDITKLFCTDDNKIKTFYCNQMNPTDIYNLWLQPEMDEPFDLMIQNGNSRFDAVVVFFENSIHRLKKEKNRFYVVEDIFHEELHLFKEIISRKWEIEYPYLNFKLVILHSPFNRINNNLLVVSVKS